jgi:glucose/arabinose dehydrogenase
MGHRNPQGLYYDKANNFILESEHGPKGGGELNLIDLTKTSEDIPNYGWPIVSYGEHYGGKNAARNKKKYKKYPLHKSHTEYGFIEPLKDFTPSIGCSEIVKIGKNKYVLASLGRSTPGEKSLFFFELSDKKELVKFEQVKVFERVRDLRFKDNKLYLFMENTASIGVIDLDS